MYTSLISKDTTLFPKEVAHLYEHWFIASFFEYVEAKLNIDRGVIGYVGGNTYANILFIEAWFYDEKVATVFQEYVTNEVLDAACLAVAVQQCAAEDRELWHIRDKKLLDAQLAALMKQPWQSDDELAPFVYADKKATLESPLDIQKSASSYRLVTVLANLFNGSLEDKALLLRLHVLISDIVGRYLQQKGWYELDTLTPRESAESVYFISSICLPRGSADNKHIRDELTQYIRSFDISKNMALIDSHFLVFSTEPLWKGRVREELHHVNVIAGNKYVAELATEARIRSILHKLDIYTETVSYSFAKTLRY